MKLLNTLHLSCSSNQVHRALLAATSDFFRVMFKGRMAESNQDTVDLKGVSADGLQQVNSRNSQTFFLVFFFLRYVLWIVFFLFSIHGFWGGGGEIFFYIFFVKEKYNKNCKNSILVQHKNILCSPIRM